MGTTKKGSKVGRTIKTIISLILIVAMAAVILGFFVMLYSLCRLGTKTPMPPENSHKCEVLYTDLHKTGEN